MFSINNEVQKLRPGDVLRIPAGVYHENVKMDGISGTKDAPIHIKADGEVVINGGGGEVVFAVVNCEYIIIEGLKVTNAHMGIDVKSTPARGASPLDSIVIRNNEVYGIDGPEGGHSISVYGENPHAPITGLLIDGNRVYDNRLYWSEALVVNGNIDGFVISGNIVWNNDNIGIDIIGFEGKAGEDPSVDCARNGKVFDNVVYGSNTTANEAYWSENHNHEGDGEAFDDDDDEFTPIFGGKYDRCCGGIYVDGGLSIEIYHNFVFDNDLGIEIATEHKPPLVTRDVHVHDNIIANSTGWAGLIFGGYASNLGFTEDCMFENNILYNNDTSIAVQKSQKNTLQNNLIVGGYSALEFNGDMGEMNDFKENFWAENEEEEDFFEGFAELPPAQTRVQVRGTVEMPTILEFETNFGTAWRPNKEYLGIYERFCEANDYIADVEEELNGKEFSAKIVMDKNVIDLVNAWLVEEGHNRAYVRKVLKSKDGNFMLQIAVSYTENAYVQRTVRCKIM